MKLANNQTGIKFRTSLKIPLNIAYLFFKDINETCRPP